MKRVFKAGAALLGALLLLVGVLALNTLRFEGPPPLDTVELPAPPSVDEGLAAVHLGEAIQFQTVTTNPGDPIKGEEGPWLALQAWLSKTYPLMHGAMTRESVDGYSLLYSWPGSDPSADAVVLMSHQDVVPVNPGTEQDWDAPPFAGVIQDGYVYGRGALDTKGSLIGICEAVEALLATGFEPTRPVYIIFGHDEEIVTDTGARYAFEALKARGVRAELVVDEGSGVLKPSPFGASALGAINIAEKGWISLRLIAHGTGGHSSSPPRNSATVRLARAIAALDDEQMPAQLDNETLQPMIQGFAAQMPFIQRMALTNLWLLEDVVAMAFGMEQGPNAMIRTTTAPTMLKGSAKENVLAQRAEGVVNFRIHPGNNAQDVIEHVTAIADRFGDIDVEVMGEVFEPAPVSSTDSRGYRVLHSVASQLADGGPVIPMLQVGLTDSRHAFLIADNVYRFTPQVSDINDVSGVHGTNERVALANVATMARSYAQIILAMDTP
ncbi:MAG: M20/M25/M40 family metallo-hydrolase [Pseudomonadota bacterium]